MTRIILTTSDSGAGCLKASGIANEVAGFGHRLVAGPVVQALDPEQFAAARAQILGRSFLDESGPTDESERWEQFVARCIGYDTVEIWVDPLPNAQLQLSQLLTWFNRYPDVLKKLVLVHSDSPIGERKPNEITMLSLQYGTVGRDEISLAKEVMTAFEQPTPEPWFDLLHKDVSAFPYLRGAICRMLEELPALDTALSATESRVLKAVSIDEMRPLRIIADLISAIPPSILDYWELGRVLDSLAGGQVPAIVGLKGGPFSLEMHADRSLFEMYKNSTLRLSELGLALTNQRADFSEYNEIARWWGGTRLTNERLWRWDSANKRLVAPR